MPPDIEPPAQSVPLAIIRAAVRAATKNGEVVSTGPDLGMVCDSTHAPGWVRDPRVPTLSPLGAVLFVHNPPVGVADEALGHVLGTSPLWVLGFDDACSGQRPEASAIVRGPAVRLYGEGFRAGAEFRALHGVPATDVVGETTPPRGIIQQLLSSLTVADVLDLLVNIEEQRSLRFGGAAREAHQQAVRDLRALADNFRADGV